MTNDEKLKLKALYIEPTIFSSIQSRLDYLLKECKPLVIKYQLYEEASKMRDFEKKLKEQLLR